jgi:hypothetical protein
VTARIGADDLDLFLEPQPELLESTSGIRPERGGLHVRLDTRGVRSTQRLALSGFRGGLIAALWPAELKVQAKYLYGNRLATLMISRALERGWSAEPSPHLAFRNAAASQRLYMRPVVEAAEYARRWESTDLRRVGQYARASLKTELWPWLKSRGYALDSDDDVLEVFMNRHLGKRPALLRPGLRLKQRWGYDSLLSMDGPVAAAATIRADVNAILAAAQEPPLPGS